MLTNDLELSEPLLVLLADLCQTKQSESSQMAKLLLNV